MVENVWVAVGIASPSVSVQKLFAFPVSTSGFVAVICVSDVCRCRDRVSSTISESGIVESVGVAVGIASPALSVQKLFPLLVCDRHFISDRRFRLKIKD